MLLMLPLIYYFEHTCSREIMVAVHPDIPEQDCTYTSPGLKLNTDVFSTAMRNNSRCSANLKSKLLNLASKLPMTHGVFTFAFTLTYSH